jgi:hypothetical protein
MESCVSDSIHPSAPHDLPGFITALHSLPEQMAHKSQKLQFEIVAVLGLLALFTHNRWC